MGEQTKIEWATHTLNPWRGCTKVSPGCANCYADAQAARNPKVLGVWGKDGTRVVAGEAMWREPLKWDRDAKAAGVRPRVFCASMADVFEDWGGPMVRSDGEMIIRPFRESENLPENWDHSDSETMRVDPQGWKPITMSDVRDRLFRLIDATPNLDWLLLTKRPENALRMVYSARCRKSQKDGGDGRVWRMPPNLWLGVSVEDQKTADERIPVLLKVPASVRFISYEPALGPVDFSSGTYTSHGIGMVWDAFGVVAHLPGGRLPVRGPGIDWVIVGGESGPQARPFDIAWARSTVAQCKAAGVACFVKQLGSNPVFGEPTGVKPTEPTAGKNAHGWSMFRDPKGGDMSEWPADIRVREFPKGGDTK